MNTLKDKLLNILQDFSEENGIYFFVRIAGNIADMETGDYIEFSCNPYPDDDEGFVEREKVIQESDNNKYYNDILLLYLTCPDYEEDF